MKDVLLGIIIGCVIWKVVWKLIIVRIYGQRIIDWTERGRYSGEIGKIKAQLKQGMSLDQIANKCNFHDRDDVLRIKNEMWENGWDNS